MAQAKITSTEKNDLGITETLLVPKFICLTLFVAHIYDNAPAKHD